MTCLDCNYGELYHDVEHNVQGAPSPAAHHQDEDRLEQDNRVQDRQRTEFEGRGRLMLELTTGGWHLHFLQTLSRLMTGPASLS